MAKATIKKPAALSAAKTGATADNLLLIKGIGPVNNTKLLAHGIASFAQIAAWKKSDVVSVEKYLEFDGRIAREDWIGQAARLAKAAKSKPAQKPAMAKTVSAKPAASVNAAAPVPKPAAKAKAVPAAKPTTAAKAKTTAAAAQKKVSSAPKVSKAAPAATLTSAMPVQKAKSAPAARAAAKVTAETKAAPAKAAVTIKAPAPAMPAPEPIMTARGLVKRYGRVTALNEADFDLRPNEILAVIGDNGAGKSSLIKAVSGRDYAGRGRNPH